MLRKTLLANCVLALSGLALAGTAMAQSASGYATIIRVPVAVNTATFSTTLNIHNPNLQAITVGVTYYGAVGTSSPFQRACTAQTIASGATSQVTLAALCGFGIGTSNFGHLRLQEVNIQNRPFAVYSRVSTFGGDGFSVEGFPIGSITGSTGWTYATGLRRQAGAPGYTSNCFVGSKGEAVDVEWSLFDDAGAQIGATQTTPLAANQMVRFLNVFSAVGAPAGDINGATARFGEVLATGEPGFMAFCTVQNNTSFDADFRMAKENEPADERSDKFSFSATTGLGAVLSIPDFATQDVLGIYLQHPDFVQCALSGSGSADLEMRLKDPQGNVVAGGNNVTSFGEVYLGERSTRNSGQNGLWTLEVENGSFALTYPKTYGVSCESGNGANRALQLGTEPAEF